tara:strand:+ start:90 stop:677 length:588 start_codon:yes stop_codon:yes gene_type:complete
MTFRIEKKYKLHASKLSEFYTFLNNNSSKELYPRRLIKSVYFDNNQLSSYHDSIEGVVPRKKIRVRSYPNNSSDFNLEIKINSIEGRYKSTRKQIDYLDMIKRGYFDINYGLCRPILEIEYFRDYFSLLGLRVTLDTSISYQKFKKKKIIPYNELIALEVKSNNLQNLNYLDSLFNWQSIRFSKYCNAIEELEIA